MKLSKINTSNKQYHSKINIGEKVHARNTDRLKLRININKKWIRDITI